MTGDPFLLFSISYYIYIYVSSGSGQNVTKCIPIDIFGPRDPFTFWLQFGKCQNISWSKNDFQAPCRSGPHNLHEVRVDDKRLKLMVCTCVCAIDDHQKNTWLQVFDFDVYTLTSYHFIRFLICIDFIHQSQSSPFRSPASFCLGCHSGGAMFLHPWGLSAGAARQSASPVHQPLASDSLHTHTGVDGVTTPMSPNIITHMSV